MDLLCIIPTELFLTIIEYLDSQSLTNLISTNSSYKLYDTPILYKQYLQRVYNVYEDSIKDYKKHSLNMDRFSIRTCILLTLDTLECVSDDIYILGNWLTDKHIYTFVNVINHRFNINIDTAFILLIKDNTIVKLCYTHNDTYNEIAFMTDITFDTIIVRTDRAYCQHVYELISELKSSNNDDIMTFGCVLNDLLNSLDLNQLNQLKYEHDVFCETSNFDTIVTTSNLVNTVFGHYYLT